MSDSTPRSEVQQMSSKLMRSAIWIAIGSLIAAALVCVVWVLIGDQDGIIGRAFLTILLLAVFAGIAIMESHLAEHRPEWLALSSMITWIVALLVGAVKIWMPEHDPFGGWSLLRFWQLLLVVGIMQLALVHVRLFLPASKRYVTTFTRVIAIVTIALLVLLVALLVFYLTFPDLFHYDDLYWRIVIALAILVAVGTTLIPLLNALFAPKKKPSFPVAPHTAPAGSLQGAAIAPQAAQGVSAWPTYADGRTPLPVLPDGSPDWNAYYTGHPTYAAPAQSFPTLPPAAPAAQVPDAAAPAAPGAAPQSFPIQDATPPAAPVQPFQAPVAPASAEPSPPDAAPQSPPAYGAFPPPPPAAPGAGL